MAITVISVQLSPEQQKVLDSLNPRQRRIYDATPGKVDFLEGILEDRKKSVHLLILKWLFYFVILHTYTDKFFRRFLFPMKPYRKSDGN